MSFLEAMEAYFRGERVTGLALVPVGLVLVAAAIYLFQWYGGVCLAALAMVVDVLAERRAYAADIAPDLATDLATDLSP